MSVPAGIQVFMLLAENRSLRNELNTLKQYDASVSLKIEGRRVEGVDLTLTAVELDAVSDFISVRKLRARHLRRTPGKGQTLFQTSLMRPNTR